MSITTRYSNKAPTQTYFECRPDIVKIFTDLEAFHDFCRIELLPFNEADLYNKYSKIWQSYERGLRPRKPWNGEKKPYHNNKTRSYNNNKPRTA